LLALAIVEHLMLVLPVDTTALWRWALRKKQNNTHAVNSEPQTVSVIASAMDKHDKLFQIH
jgi:hypothetical protein